MNKFYCMVYSLYGYKAVSAFADPDAFYSQLKRLYRAFEAPSTIGTCTLLASDASEAYDKAVDFFIADGWNIKREDK